MEGSLPKIPRRATAESGVRSGEGRRDHGHDCAAAASCQRTRWPSCVRGDPRRARPGRWSRELHAAPARGRRVELRRSRSCPGERLGCVSGHVATSCRHKSTTQHPPPRGRSVRLPRGGGAHHLSRGEVILPAGKETRSSFPSVRQGLSRSRRALTLALVERLEGLRRVFSCDASTGGRRSRPPFPRRPSPAPSAAPPCGGRASIHEGGVGAAAPAAPWRRRSLSPRPERGRNATGPRGGRLDAPGREQGPAPGPPARATGTAAVQARAPRRRIRPSAPGARRLRLPRRRGGWRRDALGGVVSRETAPRAAGWKGAAHGRAPRDLRHRRGGRGPAVARSPQLRQTTAHPLRLRRRPTSPCARVGAQEVGIGVRPNAHPAWRRGTARRRAVTRGRPDGGSGTREVGDTPRRAWHEGPCMSRRCLDEGEV